MPDGRANSACGGMRQACGTKRKPRLPGERSRGRGVRCERSVADRHAAPARADRGIDQALDDVAIGAGDVAGAVEADAETAVPAVMPAVVTGEGGGGGRGERGGAEGGGGGEGDSELAEHGVSPGVQGARGIAS